MSSFSELISRGRLVWRLLNDVRVPAWIKIAIPLIVLLYFITPVDFIPDFIPVLGQIDDVGVLLLGMSLIIRLSPQYVVDEHREALGYDVPAGASPEVGNGKERDRSRTAAKTQTADETIEGEYKIVRPREND